MEKLIGKLDEYRPDQVPEIQSMQKSLKLASLKKNFKQHPAMQMLLDSLRKREAGYTIILSNKEDLDEGKRQAYFARRAEVRFILSFFDVDQTIDTIERQLDKELDAQLSDDVVSGDNPQAG